MSTLNLTGPYEYTYITTATTTQVFSGTGTLHAIVVNTTAAGTIGIVDNITGTTVNIGSLKSNVAEGTYFYEVVCKLGCRIVTGASSDITVVWSK